MESWRAKLAAGDAEGAWDEFITRYRRLILATIRRTLGDDDDLADVFAEVCANLSADDLARLHRHTDSRQARFSTWLVTVVHHQAIDWVRQRDDIIRYGIVLQPAAGTPYHFGGTYGNQICFPLPAAEKLNNPLIGG